MPLTMTNLENCFNQAALSHANFVAVKVEMSGFPEPEIIINSQPNIQSKLEYYKATYDENLEHKHAAGIKIVAFTHGEDFDDIYEDLA